MGPENELSIALGGKKIVDASMEELNQLFRRCILKVGIRAANFPSKEETAVLYAHIVKNYGVHTTAEIDLAFEMAITGKLDVDVNPYENFSCTYVSKIINAFRSWASQVIPHIRTSKEDNFFKYDFNWRGVIETDYQNYLSGKGDYHLYAVEYYEQLVSDGFIFPFLYKELMTECRDTLRAEVALRIAVEKNASQSETEEYNNTMDLEKKLIEYRAGARDYEVVLLAKQKCISMLFCQAKEKGFKQLYVKE